jgi:filamentous hemagglutinin family protein
MTASKTLTTPRPQAQMPAPMRVLPASRPLLRTTSVLALLIAAFPLPALAQVVGTPSSGTTVAAAGISTTNVTTTAIHGGVAFNQFSQFNVASGDVVNLFQPLGASALVNIISGGQSTIAGTVNGRIGAPGGASLAGGNLYLLNSDGFMVTTSGRINAGQLTLSTPTVDFMNQLVTEAGGGAAVTHTLFAGQEPLSSNGEIDMRGEINARRVDMRAGLRMIVDGRIRVETTTSTGPLNPSVNMDGVPTAGGVNISRDGVIRLVSGGSARVSGDVSARGSLAGFAPHGGLIEVIAAADLEMGGVLDVSNGGGAAGSVMLYTTGSAILEPGLTIRAQSTAGTGGFVALRAMAPLGAALLGAGPRSVTTATSSDAAIVIDTGSPTAPGEAFLISDTIDLAQSLSTDGGALGIRGTDRVTLGRDGGAITISTARAGGAAGDIVVSSKVIEVTPGTSLNAQGNGEGNGGLILLSARNVSDSIGWAVDVDSEVARITITEADIAAGSVVISAVARASTVLGSDTDEALEEGQVVAMEASTTDAQFAQMLDNLLTVYDTVVNRAVTSVNDLVPLQIKVLEADAQVVITDSRLTADGNWTPFSASITDGAAEFADNGFLSVEGLREDSYSFLAASSIIERAFFDDAYQLNIRLPSEIDLARDTLVVHSHAMTETVISPFSFAIDLAVSSTKTVSAVHITDSHLLTNAGDLRLAATASESQTIAITAKKVPSENFAVGIAVSVRNLANQVKVDGGSLRSAGGISAGAFTGRNLSSMVIANSGQEGEISIGINADFSNSLTEVALGGEITAQNGDVRLDAEQLFFNVTRVTTATMGLGNLQKAVTRHRTTGSNTTGFAQRLQQKATGKTPDPNRKPHFGMGAAVDLQINDDNAFATLGGTYHSIDNISAAPVPLGMTTVTATDGAVEVNAAYRFADRGSEGGGSLSRATSAAFDKLTSALSRQLARENARLANEGRPPITEDELLGRYSKGLMFNLSLSSLIGETRAEIGAAATVTASRASVEALTRYPNTNPWQSLVNQWETYVAQVTSYSPVETGGPADPPEPAPPPAPDLAGFLDIIDPRTYLTTDSKAKGDAPVAGDRVVVPGQEQALALGISLTYFNTDNITTAIIREGATVNLDAAASVSALQESMFLHVVNLPKKNPLGGSAKVNDAIGGGIFFSRTVSNVRAEIESGAVVVASDLDVTATTANFAASLAFSGGQGSDVAINASIAAHVSEAETVARIGADARITAEEVTISATDRSVTWASAGAVTGSENVGVGASGVFNFSSRTVWAGIGTPDAPLASAPEQIVISASGLTIAAENETVDITVAVAGTKVVGKEDPPADTPPPANTEDDDMIVPTWLFSDEEEDAAEPQQQTQTPADSDGNRQTTGWAVSGAAAVNLALRNETAAEILTRGTLRLTGDLDLMASSTATMVNLGGAVSSGLGSQKDTNALAGAFAVHVDERRLRARITGATVTAEERDISLMASDEAQLVTIAVGGAGTSRGDIALAGSVTVAVLSGGTLAEVEDAEIASESLTISADDISTTVSVAGAVGVNMDATQGYGVGVGIAVNTVARDAMARVTGAGSIRTGDLALEAISGQAIFGFGTSAGLGMTGLSGSITVNTISGGAKALIDGGAGVRQIQAATLSVIAEEDNEIFALSGALAGGRGTAVGGALSVNTIVARTEARAENITLTARDGGPDSEAELGEVEIAAISESAITAIAVAGAAALEGEAAGVGLAVNTITADSIVSLADSVVQEAESLSADASGERIIRSLAGGAAAAGRGAAGAGLSVNLLVANDTRVILDRAVLSTVEDGDISATAIAAGEIAALAAGISASRDTAIGGALTLNVTTARTEVSAENADLWAGGALDLAANDSATIRSAAGGAALGVGAAGVGGAVAANFIAHDTGVITSGNSSLAGRRIGISAQNGAEIQSAAVGLAASDSNAFAGSVAIGNIANTTRAQALGSLLAADSGAGEIAITATRSGTIDILSGTAAFGGANAVGGAVSIATITGAVTADVVDNGAGGGISAESLVIAAADSAAIDAIAVSGVAGAGGSGGAGSLVYTQIGRAGPDGPSVAPLPGGPEGQDPLAAVQASVIGARDGALGDLATNLSGRGDLTIDPASLTLDLESDDVVRARLQTTGVGASLPQLSITATQTGATRSLAGAAGGGTNASFGAGFALNLIFGKAEAELILPDQRETYALGEITVTAAQVGNVDSAGLAGGASGSIGGAGSVTINVMNRQAAARIASAQEGRRAALWTGMHDVTLGVTQAGAITSAAGAVGIGGTGGVGGAISVTVLSDDADVVLQDVVLDGRGGPGLEGAGTVTISADQDHSLWGGAAALGGGAGGAFAGSFVVNIADGEVGARLRDSVVMADTLRVTTIARPKLSANAGALAVGATGAVGLAIASNVARQTVRTDIDRAILLAHGPVILTARAEGDLSGAGVSGAADAVAGITGTGIGNSARNTVEVLVRDSAPALPEAPRGGSAIMTVGTVLLSATASNRVSLKGGSEEEPGLNVSFAGGGVAGVGASATVNALANAVRVGVSGNSRITGLGQSGVDIAGTEYFGVIADAAARASIDMLTANGAVGGIAGVAALMSLNLIEDGAHVVLGTGEQAAPVQINGAAADFAPLLGTDSTDARQDARFTASTEAAATVVTANIAVGGKAGVGAGSGTLISRSEAGVDLRRAQVTAARDIVLDAGSETDLQAVTLGLAGGFVGVAANAGVTVMGAKALVDIDDAILSAGRDMALAARVTSNSTAVVGAAAGGAVGASGGVQVTVFDSLSRVSVGRGESPANSTLAAEGDLSLTADTVLALDGKAVSGAVGGSALALALNVGVITAQTLVDIGPEESLSALEALTLRARDTISITGMAGSLGVGGLGGGASLEYARFAGGTRVRIGDGALLRADAGATRLAAPASSARNIVIEALSERRVTSSVVALGGAVFAVNAALGVIDMGAVATDEAGNRDRLLDDAEAEFTSDLRAEGDGLTEEERRATAGGVMTHAGADATRATVAAERQALRLNGPAAPDAVSVSLGDNVILETRGNLTLRADAATFVTQTAGGLSAGAFGGSTSGVGVSSLSTSVGVEIGTGAQLRADGAIALSARNGAISGENLLSATGFTLAASVGYAVGVGIVTTTVAGTSALTLGADTRIGGYLGARATAATLSAMRDGGVAVDVRNASLSLAGGAGLVISSAGLSGGNAIALGSARITARDVTVAADDTSRAVAAGEGSSGGIGGGLNSVIVTAAAETTGTLSAQGAEIDATTARIANESAVSAQAQARGLAVGAVAIGASVATSDVRVTLDSDMTATLRARDIALVTRLRASGFDTSVALSNATSGGILAGNGAVSSAWSTHAVSARFAGNFHATNETRIDTGTQALKARANASGVSGGLMAAGLTIAQVGQNQDAALAADDRLARVDLTLENATFTGKSVVIETANVTNTDVAAISGSGGLTSGAASEAIVTTASQTQARIGQASAVAFDGLETLSIMTGQAQTLASLVDTTSAAALGSSGAVARGSVSSTVAATIGGGVAITAQGIEIGATNAVNRPDNGLNMRSGSGGVFDAAAMASMLTVAAQTDLTVEDGASIRQIGLVGNADPFALTARNVLSVTDHINLDSGGVTALPRGVSHIDVTASAAHVTVGGATLFALEDLNLRAGSDAKLKAEVNANTYGLSGAASGASIVTLNADNRVVLQDGALLESLGNIHIGAGYGANGVQTVDLHAETRLFNKTAFPIAADPAADAMANTASIIDVQAGARVLAVRNVYLFSEAGQRSVLGYGRGKDLYREVLAELGTAISEAFGGEPVSLDLESGTAQDISDDGILVNGYVRAGSRNRQILVINEDGNIQNSRIGEYTNDMADGITWALRKDVSVSREVKARMDLLQRLLDDPILNSDPEAVAAWSAERATLAARDSTGTADFLDLEDITAAQGDIVLRADYVHGTETGTLDAPANAEIIIHSYARDGGTARFINTKGMEILLGEGGRIFFNDVTVTTPAEITALSDPARPGPDSYDMISGATSGEPKIEVVTFGEGSVIVGGAISNPGGLALFNANEGDLDVRADISARTIELRAGRDFLQGFTLGIRNVDGDPESIYADYFQRAEDIVRTSVAVSGALPSDLSSRLPEFELAPRRGRIQAGRNVYISADILNVNGLIQAGRGSFTVEIGAGIDADLDALTGQSARVMLYDPSEPFIAKPDGSANIIRNAHITSDVFVRFDPTALDDTGAMTGAIVINPMIVQGGEVEIVGKIISTGGGEIRSLDGFGTIDVVNHSTRPIRLERVDTGANTPEGVEGRVRITDTSRMMGSDFLITEYRRSGNSLQVFNNQTFQTVALDFDADGETDATRINPTNLVSTITADDGRSASYATLARQELVINRAETVVRTRNIKRTTTRVFFINLSGAGEVRTTVRTKTTPLDPEILTGLSGTYLTTASVDLTEPYRITAERRSFEVSQSDIVASGDEFIGDYIERWSVTETTTHLYSHRLKADQPIAITFDGTDSGGLRIHSLGDVQLAGAVRNQLGSTVIESTGGSLLTKDPTVIVDVGDATLAALGGRIGGMGSAFRIDQTEGATLTATAQNGIDLRELSGNMNALSVRTTARDSNPANALTGKVRLVADGAILGSGDGPHIEGAAIELVSINGTLGTEAAALVLREEGGALSATARDSIYLRDVAGDLNLRDVSSSLGSVTLGAASGRAVDANDIERRDLRTEAELLDLWSNDLGLFGDAAITERSAQQVAALKAERERSYRAYWQERSAQGGAPLSFTLEAGAEDTLRNTGWSDGQIAAYVAERAGLYALWNDGTEFDPAYSHAVSAEERANLLEGVSWTQEQLQAWLRAGLIRGTGDTNIRIEAPNIRAAGDITLNTIGAGTTLAPHVLGSDRAEDLRVLSSAERRDITIEGNLVSVARRDDLNIAFTRRDATDRPLGALTLGTTTADVLLGAETPIAVAQIDTTGDVEIKVDGAIFDASPAGHVAIAGRNILLESGNFAAIGTPEAPLSLNLLEGGELIARGGTGVFLTTLGDAPLAEIFSGGPLVLQAGGRILDAVGTGAVRVRAADITLSATEIGLETTPLVVEVTGPAGALDMITTTGDAYLGASGPLRLVRGRIAGGGRLVAGDALAFTGADTLVFGATATLALIAPMGIDLSASTGTDITGGTLSLIAGGPVGTLAKPLATALAAFDMGSTGTAAAPLVMTEADDLAIGTVTLPVAGSDMTLTAGGTLTIGTITSAADVTLAAEAIVNGRIMGERVDLLANGTPGGIGTTTRMDLTAATLRARSLSGDIMLGLRDRDTEVESITAGGTGQIDIAAADIGLTLLAGATLADALLADAGITTQGGAVRVTAGSLDSRADILSRGGRLSVTTTGNLTNTGNLTQAADTSINAGNGVLQVSAEGDMQIARIETGNASAEALRLTVGGALSVAPGQSGPQVVANAGGARSILRLGALTPVGPEGLGVALDVLDLEVTDGPVHLKESDAITLESVIAQGGMLDVFATGTIHVGSVRAQAFAPIVLTSATGDLISDGATLSGGEIRLFALDGAIRGTADGAFRGDASDHSTLHVFAGADLSYTETAGNLRAGFALSDRGDLSLSAAGDMTLGILGAAGDLRLEAADALTVTMIGEAVIDLADEEALQLVSPEVYGTRAARAPRNLDLLTRNPGSSVRVGLAGARETMEIVGDHIDVMAHDETPQDGLEMTVQDASGDLAERVDITSVGAGVRPFIAAGQYFDDPRPLLADRSRTTGATGTLTLTTGYIRTGDISHAGPALLGEDIRIGDTVWFRQGSFDLLAETAYRLLSTVADSQVLAHNGGRMTFELRNDILLDTIADGRPVDGSGGTVLVLNRRLGGVHLNGGQGYPFGVGVETGILGWRAGLAPLRPDTSASGQRLTRFVLAQEAE